MASALPMRPNGRFLRYEFDSSAQLRRHCRLVDGHVLLFFHDAGASLIPRSRALIEICVADADQQVAIAAVVHSRVESARPGAWLELRTLSAVSGLLSAAKHPRRRQRRLAYDQLAWVNHEGGPVLACPVLDLSHSGARLWGVPGAEPAAGEHIRVRFSNAATLVARIVWAHGREVGIAFAAESLPTAETLYARVEAQWAAARVIRHQYSCPCATGGEPLDPPWPSMSQHAGGAQ